MATSEPASKAAMLPRMIEVIVRIVAAGIMANPPVAVGVHVRNVGMPLFVGKVAVFRCRMSSPAHGRWTVRGNVAASDAAGSTASWLIALRQNRKSKNEKNSESPD
jgi:hypothetical protein